ncbi:Glycerophosphocholine acyltransferase 1 [Entamoeba marina]
MSSTTSPSSSKNFKEQPETQILTMGGTELTQEQLMQIQSFRLKDLKLLDKNNICCRCWSLFGWGICNIRTHEEESIDVLYEMVFVLSMGPLLTAIPVWNNSLVFHDFDKLTSVSIHFLPSMVIYCFDSFSKMSIPKTMSFKTGFIYPTLVYFAWQTTYLIITEVFRKDVIYEEGYMTSVRWLTEEKPHVAINFFKRFFSPRTSALVVMIFAQFVMHFLSTLPWLFFHQFKWAQAVYMIICFSIALWNGANYYFEVFVNRYSRYMGQFQHSN